MMAACHEGPTEGMYDEAFAWQLQQQEDAKVWAAAAPEEDTPMLDEEFARTPQQKEDIAIADAVKTGTFPCGDRHFADAGASGGDDDDDREEEVPAASYEEFEKVILLHHAMIAIAVAKKKGFCSQCKFDFTKGVGIGAAQFDHRSSKHDLDSTKDASICEYGHWVKKGVDAMVKELEKCDLLCKACNQQKNHDERKNRTERDIEAKGDAKEIEERIKTEAEREEKREYLYEQIRRKQTCNHCNEEVKKGTEHLFEFEGRHTEFKAPRTFVTQAYGLALAKLEIDKNIKLGELTHKNCKCAQANVDRMERDPGITTLKDVV